MEREHRSYPRIGEEETPTPNLKRAPAKNLNFNPLPTFLTATTEMADDFCHRALRGVVAQLCHSLGWHSIHSSSCDVLAELLSRYMLSVARTTTSYSTHGEAWTSPLIIPLFLSYPLSC